MSFIDDDEPRAPARRLTAPLLDPLGIEELERYIAELREEIARVEAAIARKQQVRGAADAFFRKPPEA